MITFPEKWKQIDKKQVGVIFLVGVLLIIIAMPTTDTSSVESGNIQEETTIDSVIALDEDAYKEGLEESLADILSNVEGVGEVQVMITLKTGTEKVVEKDITLSESSGETTSELNQEEATIYAEEDGNQVPYVTQEIYPEIEGVVVAATGGGSAVVVQNITEAVQALFDVDTHKIKIMKLVSQ